MASFCYTNLIADYKVRKHILIYPLLYRLHKPEKAYNAF
jgi:hypothetical protein